VAETERFNLGPELTHSPITGAVIGLIAGMMSSLLGIGGGLFMVPALILLLNIRPHRAVGTSLAVVVPTAAVAAWRYQVGVLGGDDAGSLDLIVALLLAIGGVSGALLGALLANALDAKSLRRVFGVFVALTGVMMIVRNIGGDVQAGAVVQRADSVFRAIQMLGLGAAVGAVAGLLGIGGGLVFVPALALLMAYPQKLAQGTALLVSVPVALSGSRIHHMKGNIIYRLAAPMALMSVIGAYGMAEFVGRATNQQLGVTFGVFLIAVGTSMIISRRARPAAVAEEPE